MGIFRISPNHSQLQNYLSLFQRSIDVDLASEKVDIHLVAGLLKAYFRTLEKSVFPTEHYPSLLLCGKIDDEQEKIAVINNLFKTQLNREDYNTLYLVFKLLNSISLKSEQNLMSSRNIAVCWCPTLFHSGNEAEELLMNIIDNHDKIFENFELKANINNGVNVSVKAVGKLKVEKRHSARQPQMKYNDSPHRKFKLKIDKKKIEEV